jgi:hypothetical protein
MRRWFSYIISADVVFATTRIGGRTAYERPRRAARHGIMISIGEVKVASKDKGQAGSRRSKGRSRDQALDQKEALTSAYEEAARTASRSSFMGAVGFGLALLMATAIGWEGSFLEVGFGLEKLLFAGGVVGGLTFTVLALRASRAARACRRRLDAGR